MPSHKQSNPLEEIARLFAVLSSERQDYDSEPHHHRQCKPPKALSNSGERDRRATQAASSLYFKAARRPEIAERVP
jgi:hypothetical protein